MLLLLLLTGQFGKVENTQSENLVPRVLSLPRGRERTLGTRLPKCPVQSIDFVTNFGTRLFSTAAKPPWFPEVGKQNTSYLSPPADRSLIKSVYMPLLSPYLPRVRGDGGFNWLVHLWSTHNGVIVQDRLHRPPCLKFAAIRDGQSHWNTSRSFGGNTSSKTRIRCRK